MKPERLWHYFEEISKIPHCSGNEERIINYIENFAKKNGLIHKKDKKGNVVVIKEATSGYETAPTTVLQAHVDMVCEKDSSVEHDFDIDPIKLVLSGDTLKAEGTTLGADNGIGVAAMLAILEDTNLKHGKIECLFTVEEETGLKGAFELGDDMITGKYLLNLDSEEIGTVYIGSAGGIESKMNVTYGGKEIFSKSGNVVFGIKVYGLKGGHSGGDIDKGRGNSIKLMARLLYNLLKKYSISLVDINGGDKHNAIPRECTAEVVASYDPESTDENAVEGEISSIIKDFTDTLRKEYGEVERGLKIDFYKIDIDKVFPFDSDATDRIVKLLMAVPHGVMQMSRKIKGLVESSTNLASIKTDVQNHAVEIYMHHRSSSESVLDYLIDVHHSIASLSGARIESFDRYPAWDPDPESKLLKIVKESVGRVLGRPPIITAIHAGLESAVIKKKYPGMEVVSIGPTIDNPHSPDEAVSVSSVQKFWDILVDILASVR